MPNAAVSEQPSRPSVSDPLNPAPASTCRGPTRPHRRAGPLSCWTPRARVQPANKNAQSIRMEAAGDEALRILRKGRHGQAVRAARRRAHQDSGGAVAGRVSGPRTAATVCLLATRFRLSRSAARPKPTSPLRASVPPAIGARVASFTGSGSGPHFVKSSRSSVAEVGDPAELAGRWLAQRRVRARSAWSHGK